MRVVRRDRDERGAAAIVIAVCVTVLFGAAAIVIDAGDIWQERRQLTAATDAAALAAAQDEALDVDGCSTSAGPYLVDNSPGASLTGCIATGGAVSGRVQVDGQITVTHALAEVLGRSSTVVDASSTAEWGIPAAVYGLRPFALCAESPGYQAWLASGNSTTQVFRILYNKEQPDHCGNDAPGNWGLADFDGGANSNADTVEWVAEGYDGLVTAPKWYAGDTGSFSNTLPIGSIVGQTIELPVFDAVSPDGGANVTFHITSFVSLQIVGFKSNGPEAGRYLDVRFTRAVASGVCCQGGATDTGLRVVSLCAVETTSSCS